MVIDGSLLQAMSRNDKARLRRRTMRLRLPRISISLAFGLTAVENVALPPLSSTVYAGKKSTRSRGNGAHSRSWVLRIGRPTIPTNSLAVSASGSRSPVRSLKRRRRGLLLADEPSGALDSTNGETVMRMILTACKHGVAAVVVTHDAQLASWADRVVFLRDGRVVDQTCQRRRAPRHCLRRAAGPDLGGSRLLSLRAASRHRYQTCLEQDVRAVPY